MSAVGRRAAKRPDRILRLLSFAWMVQKCLANISDFDLELLTEYAPLVYLHPQENFLPSSIDFALKSEQVSLNSSNAGTQPQVLNSSNLNFQNNSDARNSYLTTQQALGCDTCTNPGFLRGLDPTSNTIPVYAIVIQRDANTTSVYYWLFYPFNYGRDVGLCFNNLPAALLGTAVSKISNFFNNLFGGSSSSNPTVSVNGPDAKLLNMSSSQGSAKCQGYQELIGNHVGDWEHVEVKFDSRTEPPTPEYVRLSQHDGGQIFDWGDPALQILNGSHPVVYAANGSHANYASTGVHQYSNMTILDNIVGLTDNAGKGKRWDTSQLIVPAIWRSNFSYTGSQSWLSWAGHWGNQQSGCDSNPIIQLISKAANECPLSSGLQGPAYYMGPNVN